MAHYREKSRRWVPAPRNLQSKIQWEWKGVECGIPTQASSWEKKTQAAPSAWEQAHVRPILPRKEAETSCSGPKDLESLKAPMGTYGGLLLKGGKQGGLSSVSGWGLMVK